VLKGLAGIAAADQAHLHLHPKNLPVMTLLPAQTQIDFACAQQKKWRHFVETVSRQSRITLMSTKQI